ncbi:MAG: PBP1A family penicillin-binding protein [Arcobacteraceae bacterium]|nr:PBP1A family penicillin-binding protein [Arcobacteraceae bacterium]
MKRKLTIAMMSIGGIFLLWILFIINQIRIDINKVVDYNPPLTTQFYDRNDKLVANVFEGEHRFYAPFRSIPHQAIESIVAIEDTNFFEHGGINLEAINRAILKDVQHMSLVEGASTLTQQLVKTMLLTRDKKFTRKLKEVVLSFQIESLLTKEEILERYLNQVYFGHGYYGIRTAALGYFHKDLNQLNLKEIAMLVGLPKAPSFYDPTKNIKFSISRGNQVITRLQTLGWINEKQYNDAMNFVPTVYNDTATQNKAPYVVDAVLKDLQTKYPDIRTGGYRIKLTIDVDAQKIADDALQFGYEGIRSRDQKLDTNKSTSQTLNGAIIVLDSATGGIMALSGGVDFAKSSYNRAISAIRQPGSSVKPFIYQSALDLGYTTQSEVADIARTFEYKSDNNEIKKWQPKNYENNYKGLVTLRDALVHSRNLATINLVMEIGLDKVYKDLHRYGFKDIPYDMSITLGSFGVTPLKLSELYTIFSNQGVKVTPYLVDSIEYKSKILEKSQTNSEVITSPSQVAKMTSILKDVVGYGTGAGSAVDGIQLAGKTGTTNRNMDAWFCAYSPTIQTVVWFGNDDNKPMRISETGGRGAAPVVGYFYKNWIQVHPETKRYFDNLPTEDGADSNETTPNLTEQPVLNTNVEF